MTAAPIGEHDEQREKEGDARDHQGDDLWPLRGVCCPGLEFLGRADLSRREVTGGVEDCEGGGHEREDNEGAGTVNAAEDDFAQADFKFNCLEMG